MYSMEQTSKTGKEGIREVENFLRTLDRTNNLQNVENNLQYQKKDVDLIWTVNLKSGKIKDYLCEVKTDTYDRTGNFFFETISNKSKNTPGCFMYTEADFILYYFIKIKELYVLPMPATRNWFKENMNNFKEISTTTSVRNGSYISIGRLVPIKVAEDSVGKNSTKTLDKIRKFSIPDKALLDEKPKNFNLSTSSQFTQNSKAIFLQQAGILKDDSSLSDLRKSIYQTRGRSETNDDVSF